MLKSFRFWLGLGASLGFMLLFLWKVEVDFPPTGIEITPRLDWGGVWRQLQAVNYFYFIPAVLVYFVALGIRSVRWHYLMLHLKSIPSGRLFPVVAIAYLSNNILPLRLGELVRAHFVGEKEQVSKASALATIGVERVLDGLTLFLFVAVVWPFVPWTEVLKDEGGDIKTTWLILAVVVALIFVVGLLAIFLLAKSPTLGNGLARLVAMKLPRVLRPKAENTVNLLIEGFGAIRSPRQLIIISLLSGPVWLAEAVVYYIVALSFDLDLGFHAILLVTATSNLATAIPSSIGGIGPFEVVAAGTLVAFGVAAEPAATYAFFVHIIALWLPVNILGLFYLWRENITLAQLARSKSINLASQEAEGLASQAQ